MDPFRASVVSAIIRGHYEEAGVPGPRLAPASYGRAANRMRREVGMVDRKIDPRLLGAALGRRVLPLPSAPARVIVDEGSVFYRPSSSERATGLVIYEGIARSVLLERGGPWGEADVWVLAIGLAALPPLPCRMSPLTAARVHPWLPGWVIMARAGGP